MATFAVNSSVKWDDSSFSTRAGGDTYNINAATLTIDTDTRYCANSSATTGTIGTATVSATQGGKVMIDARDVWHIPYDTGTGNVPTAGTSISQGGVSGILISVTSAITAAPTTAGSAMPVTGIIKIKTLTGGHFAAGAITSIGANATGAEVQGFIEVIADTGGNITGGAGTIEIEGGWFSLGTTTGSRNQVVQAPTYGGSATQYWGVWIETSAGSGVYDMCPAVYINASYWAAAQFAADGRTRAVASSTSGQFIIGSDGSSNTGYLPPSGCNIRIPNVILNTAAAASRQTNSGRQATYASLSGGKGSTLNINYANSCNWFLQVAGLGNVNYSHCADDVYPNTAGNSFGINSGSVSITDMVYGNSGGSMTYAKHRINTTGGSFTINGLACYATGANTTSAATPGGLIYLTTQNGVTLSNIYSPGTAPLVLVNCQNISLNNYFTIGKTASSLPMTSCQNITIGAFDNSKITGTGTSASTAFSFTDCNNLEFTTAPTSGGPGSVANLTLGASIMSTVNVGTAYFHDWGTKGAPMMDLTSPFLNNGISNWVFKKIYPANMTTNFVNSNSNICPTFIMQNVGAAGGTFTSIVVPDFTNGIVRGCLVTTVKLPVYAGTHFGDFYTSTTVGSLAFAFNTPTSFNTPYVNTTGIGAGYFTGLGSVKLLNQNEYVILETPYYVLGHKQITDAFTGHASNSGTYTYTYDIDINDGNGYRGSFRNFTDTSGTGATTNNSYTVTCASTANCIVGDYVTGTNIGASARIQTINGDGVTLILTVKSTGTGSGYTFTFNHVKGETIDYTKGFKMKLKALCASAAAANMLYQVYISTITDATAFQTEYPLYDISLALTGLVTGSQVSVSKDSDSSVLYNANCAGTSITPIISTNDASTAAHLIIRKAGYYEFNYPITITTAGLSMVVSQSADPTY